MSRLKLVGADFAQGVVTTRLIGEGIDLAGYVRDGELPGLEDVLLDPLLVQAAEEGLSDRLVSAAALAAHAWLHTCRRGYCAAGAPASPSFRIATIGKSVNLDFLITAPGDYRESLASSVYVEGRLRYGTTQIESLPSILAPFNRRPVKVASVVPAVQRPASSSKWQIRSG